MLGFKLFSYGKKGGVEGLFGDTFFQEAMLVAVDDRPHQRVIYF
jgi:hypothetical protein